MKLDNLETTLARQATHIGKITDAETLQAIERRTLPADPELLRNLQRALVKLGYTRRAIRQNDAARLAFGLAHRIELLRSGRVSQ